MVTIKLLGGLGNNLFQMAATIAYAARHSIDYVIPLAVECKHYEAQQPYIFKNVKYGDMVLGFMAYHENGFNYKEIPFIPQDVQLNGYFQSSKYFEDQRDKILETFDFKIETKPNICGIHVRRGDYLNFEDYHPIQSAQYYFDAILEVHNKTTCKHFIVFSDDIEFCKEMFQNLHAMFKIQFSSNKNEIEDLQLLASCNHCIMSNSSFSYWAQYLNPSKDKVIIAPAKDRWFGKALKHNVDDLYQENWILI